MPFKLNPAIRNLLKDNRIKAIGFTTVSSGVTKLIQISVGLISVPLTLKYLGLERYGLMMTIVSFVGFVSFADLGMGLSLQNKIPKYLHSCDLKSLKEDISNVFFLLFVFVSIIVIASYFFLPYISLKELFNLQDDAILEETQLSIVVFLIAFSISIPFGLAQRINDGYLEGYRNQFWISLASINGFVFLWLSIKYNYGMPFLILAIYGSNSFFLILNFLFLFGVKRAVLKPSIKLINKEKLRSLLWSGGAFFLLQIATLLFKSVDPILIANRLSLTDVSTYSISTRLLNVLILPVFIFVPSALPALNEAIIKKDFFWVKRFLRKVSLFLMLYSGFSSVILFYFCNNILSIWIGDEISFSKDLIVSLIAYQFFLNFNLVFSYVGLTTLLIKKTTFYYVITVIVSITIKFFFLERLGLLGLFYLTILIFVVLFFIPLFRSFRANNLF